MHRTTLDVPDDLNRRYMELAQQIGRQPEDVMVNALEAYIFDIAAEDARIVVARAAVARGDFLEAVDAEAETEANIATLGVNPERRAAIRTEVERAMDAAYGPCE